MEKNYSYLMLFIIFKDIDTKMAFYLKFKYIQLKNISCLSICFCINI